MTEDSKLVFEMAEESMKQAITHLEKEFHKIRAGKANPSMLDDVKVDNYGVMSPIVQVAGINTPDPRTIVIQPWDKNMIEKIERAIMAANLGFNPQNDGIVIRINVPPLTEERRRDFVKKAKQEDENTKISIRNIRRAANEEAKALEKAGIPEDEIKKLTEIIQNLTNKYIELIDKLLVEKEKEIMTV